MANKNYVVIASNNQVIYWNMTKEKAEEMANKMVAMYPEESGKMIVKEQWW